MATIMRNMMILSNSKGKQLYLAMLQNNLHLISTDEPIYWLADCRKILDVIDFCIVKRIITHYFKAELCYDLTSDHSPIIITVNTTITTTILLLLQL